MIPYEELCDALERYVARARGGAVAEPSAASSKQAGVAPRQKAAPAPAPAPAPVPAASTYAFSAGGDDDDRTNVGATTLDLEPDLDLGEVLNDEEEHERF